uniref:Phosphatidic acid phosphatase type 2/haloperoxidase domain-containing protein n=1 Tax=Panagrolaimus sp. ES5 TaxID=591445 RepID=A0AC34FEK3_9BILA
MLQPLPERNFPITFRDGQIVYPQFAYPLRPNIVPIWLTTLLSFGIPSLLILLCQIRIRSFWDVNNAILGLIYSLINASAFQVVIKWLIGGLRPHFLAVCKPDLSKVGEGVGFQNIMYTRAVCTGKESEIKEALESMPSGLAGACIGIINAFGAYRMTYSAIWDWRYNHIPLGRDGFNEINIIPGYGTFGGFEKAVATRKAGWGTDNNNVNDARLFLERQTVENRV